MGASRATEAVEREAPRVTLSRGDRAERDPSHPLRKSTSVGIEGGRAIQVLARVSRGATARSAVSRGAHMHGRSPGKPTAETIARRAINPTPSGAPAAVRREGNVRQIRRHPPGVTRSWDVERLPRDHPAPERRRILGDARRTAKPDRSSLLPPALNQRRPSRGYSVSVSECALSTLVTSW